MSAPKRVLVTGSRGWSNRPAIDGALYLAWEHVGGGRPILVSGACPTGADAIAEYIWAKHVGSDFIERHPAQNYGDWPACGPIRNKAMVEMGADICASFIGPCSSPRCRIKGAHDSHGATGCADLAEAAGIETWRYRP